MADAVDIRTRQRVVIKSLTAGSSSPIEIHRCLRRMYGEEKIDVSSVRRWVHHFKRVVKDIGDKPRSTSAKSFRRPAYSISRKGGKCVLIMKDTLWKNNLNCVKDVPMIYINFIISVTIVFEKKKIGGITSILPLVQ
jgi:hypothetical protein